MINIKAMMKALPTSALEPNRIGSITGLVASAKGSEWQDTITLLEPPAGQRLPHIDPVHALDVLLRGQGVEPEEARQLAQQGSPRMKTCVQPDRWIAFYDHFEPDTPECVPVSDFTAWLRQQRSIDDPLPAGSIAHDIVDFLDRAAEVTTTEALFRGPDNWNEPWSLIMLPAIPPPKAMIEYLPGPPWPCEGSWGEDWRSPDNPFMRWRESIRPVAVELEKALGEPVYRFADLDCDHDDDAAHRFLVLHWCCTWKPESAYIRFLLKVSGAGDVEELKSALIDPASYAQPFKMNDAFIGLEASGCTFEYLKPGRRKTVATVFHTVEAREAARRLLAQKIGAHACILAPKALVTDAWIRQTTRHCAGWSVHYMHDGQRRLIEILSSIDELCVIASQAHSAGNPNLMIPEAAQDLLWLAPELGVDTKYFGVDGGLLSNPRMCLERSGAPGRIAADKDTRKRFTGQLTKLLLGNDYGGSGLWTADGRAVGYDLIDIPFGLVRQIAAWQRDYDDTVMRPDRSDEAKWQNHDQMTQDIAFALREALGLRVKVVLGAAHGSNPVSRSGRAPEAEPSQTLTEEEAVAAFARAWNRLEPDGFLDLLATDARYVSQWVFEELVGAPAIADYLHRKMRTVRAHGINAPWARVRVEIGRMAVGGNGRACAFMTQGRDNAVQAAVVFDVADGRIVCYQLCMPEILAAVRTGVFPI